MKPSRTNLNQLWLAQCISCLVSGVWYGVCHIGDLLVPPFPFSFKICWPLLLTDIYISCCKCGCNSVLQKDTWEAFHERCLWPTTALEFMLVSVLSYRRQRPFDELQVFWDNMATFTATSVRHPWSSMTKAKPKPQREEIYEGDKFWFLIRPKFFKQIQAWQKYSPRPSQGTQSGITISWCSSILLSSISWNKSNSLYRRLSNQCDCCSIAITSNEHKPYIVQQDAPPTTHSATLKFDTPADTHFLPSTLVDLRRRYNQQSHHHSPNSWIPTTYNNLIKLQV